MNNYDFNFMRTHPYVGLENKYNEYHSTMWKNAFVETLSSINCNEEFVELLKNSSSLKELLDNNKLCFCLDQISSHSGATLSCMLNELSLFYHKGYDDFKKYHQYINKKYNCE